MKLELNMNKMLDKLNKNIKSEKILFYSLFVFFIYNTYTSSILLKRLNLQIRDIHLKNQLYLNILESSLRINTEKFREVDEKIYKNSKNINVLKKYLNLFKNEIPSNFNELTRINVDISTYTSLGSGIILKYKNKFYILTCFHLFKNKKDLSRIKVLDANKIITVKFLKKDRKKDLALFKISEPTDLIYTTLSDKEPQLNEVVFAIGNPSYFSDVASSGKVIKKTKKYYITTNPIYYGFSGGGLFYKNKLIGIIRAIKYCPTENKYFTEAINLKTIKEFVENE